MRSKLPVRRTKEWSYSVSGGALQKDNKKLQNESVDKKDDDENEEYVEYLADIHPDAQKILYGDPGVSVEYYHDLPEDTKALMNQLWEDVKVGGFNATGLIIVCGVVIVALVAFFAFRSYKRKKAMEMGSLCLYR